MADQHQNSGRVFIFHTEPVAVEALRSLVIERGSALPTSGTGLVVTKSKRHPLLMMSRPMRSQPVLRLLGATPIGSGPGEEDHWTAVEWYDFESVEAMAKSLASDSSPRGEHAGRRILATRLFRLSGSAPQSGSAALFFTLRRRDDLSRGEMQRIWFEEHAEIVRDVNDDLGFTGHTQAHTIEAPTPPQLEPLNVDALGLLHYSGVGQLALRGAAPKAMRANIKLIRDEQRFVHAPSTTLALATIA